MSRSWKFYALWVLLALWRIFIVVALGFVVGWTWSHGHQGISVGFIAAEIAGSRYVVDK